MSRGLLLTLASLLLLGATSVWLVTTESGLRTAWRITVPLVRQLTDIEMQADVVQGRVLGPLEVTGFSYQDRWVLVKVNSGKIIWQPLQLLTNRIRINKAIADQVSVTLLDAANDDSSESKASNNTLEITVHIDAAEINHTEFHYQPGSEAWLFSNSQATVEVLEDRVVVSQVKTHGFNADADAEGFISWHDDMPMVLDATFMQPIPNSESLKSHLEVKGDLKNFNLQLATEAPYTGDLSMQWHSMPEGYEVSLRGPIEPAPLLVALKLLPIESLPTGKITVDADGLLTGSAFHADKLQVVQGDSQMDASGQLDWGGSTLTFVGEANWQNLSLPPWQPLLYSANGRATINGSPDQGAINIDASYNVANQKSGKASFHANWQNDKIEISQGILAAGNSQLEAQGKLWPRAALNWSANSPDLGELWPGAQGRLIGKGGLSGDWLTPHMQGKLVGHDIRMASFELDKLFLNTDFDLENDRQGFFKLSLKGLRHTDLWPANLSLSVTGRRSDHTLKLSFKSPEISGKSQISGKWAGGSAPWTGNIRSSTFIPQGMGRWQLESPAELYAHSAQFKLGKACLKQNESSLCWQGDSTVERWQGAAQIKNMPFELLSAWIPPEIKLDGLFNGQAQFSGVAGQWKTLDIAGNAAAQLSRSNIDITDQLKLTLRKLEIKANPDQWKAGLELQLNDKGQVIAHATAEPQQGEFRTAKLRGRLQLALPRLRELTLIAPEIEQLRGEIKGDIQAAGTLDKPAFSGSLALEQGRLDLRDYGISLSPLNATLSGKSDGLLALDIQTSSDGGTLQAKGLLNPHLENPALNMSVKGERFLANRTDEATVYISPDLNIKVKDQKVELSGELSIPEARLQPGKQQTSIQTVSADQVLVTDEEADAVDSAWKFLAKIRLILGDKVSFKGMGIQTRLAGQMDIRENPGKRTVANGEIRLHDGIYEVYGQKLTIDTGRLIFANAPVTEPALDIKATRIPQTGITVGVRVRGMLDAPEVSLFSTPSMRQAEQLSYLVLGRPLEGNEGNPSLTGAALAMGLTRGDNIIGGLSDSLNVDNIGIETEAGQSSQQASLVVGKYLSPRLYVSYGAGLFESLHKLRMRYRMSEHWTLVGESGEAQGADILYTIER